MGNKVWIELEQAKPGTDRKAFAEEQCRLANNMLTRLAAPEHLPLRDTFFWSEHDRGYCYGGHMGYITLPDHGHWLNLDYLGRDIEPDTALANLQHAARAVVDNWESGDLAGAVSALEGLLPDTIEG